MHFLAEEGLCQCWLYKCGSLSEERHLAQCGDGGLPSLLPPGLHSPYLHLHLRAARGSGQV